ncbi:MAG: hypothetical protein FWC57_05650 [Endomicrobia bacterium]|nr:hypothetical protein [Endomicrobiia bacterium]
MKIDFLRILKLVLYAVSFAAIFILSFASKKTGENTKMMIIALAILILNLLIYVAAAKIYKKYGANPADAENIKDGGSNGTGKSG